MKKITATELKENANGNMLMEEWEIRFTSNGIQKLHMIRGNVKINEATAISNNFGKKGPALEGANGITVVYYKKGEDQPFGGDEVLSGGNNIAIPDFSRNRI